MKKILFASTAFATLAIAGAASADVALFGTARLGIGYNIQNNGDPDLELSDDGTQFVGTEDLRAISRIRFGFTGTGETDSGITFGATIRADNAEDAGTNDSSRTGQTEGNVFVSGAWGTLTFGDTNAADEQHVGDAGDYLSVTGLGEYNETPFVSNGGGFGDDDVSFFSDPEARPTVRYDYNFAGFGVSASTDRRLEDIGVGASYTAEFGGGSVTGGLGYYDFEGFTVDGDDSPLTPDDRTVFRGGEQYSAGLTGTFGAFTGGAVYTAYKSAGGEGEASAGGDIDTLNLGAGYTFNEAWGFSAYYAKVLDASDQLSVFDGKDSYGLSAAYDLGGGASINMGVAQTFGRDGNDEFLEVDSETVADFGITMNF